MGSTKGESAIKKTLTDVKKCNNRFSFGNSIHKCYLLFIGRIFKLPSRHQANSSHSNLFPPKPNSDTFGGNRCQPIFSILLNIRTEIRLTMLIQTQPLSLILFLKKKIRIQNCYCSSVGIGRSFIARWILTIPFELIVQ